MSRTRKMLAVSVPALLTDPMDPKLKHGSSYGQEPFKPGEIPSTRNGSRIPVYGGLDDRPQRYGEALGVQLPSNRGRGWKSGTVDLEGHETDPKQTGTSHGTSKL